MKKLKWLFLLGGIGIFVWYFFLKEYDYQFNFEVKSTVGAVNQSIKSWNSSLENQQPIKQISENELLQTMAFQDSIFTFHWKLSNKNDSIVKVSVGINEPDHQFMNRLLVPFSQPTFEKRAQKTTMKFFELLHKHLKETRVKIEGIENSPDSYAAYVSLKKLQVDKANGMMEYYSVLSNFIGDNHLEPNGPPFLEITAWDREKDSLSYNFCFPFKKGPEVKETPLISIKHVPSKKGIKAIYNGNYITSDRAWYALERYAKKNDLPVEMLPLEVFFNNPNMGGDELNWKTEVFLPLKEE